MLKGSTWPFIIFHQGELKILDSYHVRWNIRLTGYRVCIQFLPPVNSNVFCLVGDTHLCVSTFEEGFPGGKVVKNPPANERDIRDVGSISGWGRSPGRGHGSILAWRIPWTEETGRLQSTGLQRVGRDWSNSTHSLRRGETREENRRGILPKVRKSTWWSS